MARRRIADMNYVELKRRLAPLAACGAGLIVILWYLSNEGDSFIYPVIGLLLIAAGIGGLVYTFNSDEFL